MNAAEFRRLFDLKLEKTKDTTEVLKGHLDMALNIAGQAEGNMLTAAHQIDSTTDLTQTPAESPPIHLVYWPTCGEGDA